MYRISINQQNIAANRQGADLPVIAVADIIDDKIVGHFNCRKAEIDGPSKVVYDPKRSHQDGVSCWIETEAEVYFE